MFRTMHLFRLATAVAILSLTAHTAPGGKGGGKNDPPPATLLFDDLAGDAIQSDGLGSYEVSYTEGDAEHVISLTKNQEIRLDFSDCDPTPGLSCEGPFGSGTTSGFVGGATITFPTVDWVPGVTDRVGVRVYFQTSGGRWSLVQGADITPYDDDDDGAIDRYVIEHDGLTSTRLGKFHGRGSSYVEHGRFFMPWGATLRLP